MLNPDFLKIDRREFMVVVQLECATNLQVEKDSSLPLGMTTKN